MKKKWMMNIMKEKQTNKNMMKENMIKEITPKKLNKIIGLSLVAAVMLSGCGSSDKDKEPQNKVIKEYDVNAEISESFGEDMNRFAFELYDEIAKEKGEENMFFSPYSVTCALSMLDNAAEDTTKKELEEALHISNDIEERNSDLKLFADSFTDEKAVMNTANSTWISENLDLREDSQENFFDPVTFYYNAESKKVNFGDDETVEAINDWISDKTEGMIQKMISKLDPDTDMCLINAVYFKGEWTTVFEESDTQERSFYGVKSEKTVDMMYQYGNKYKYVETNGLKGIRLPYGENQIAMEVWIADDENSKNAVEVFGELSTDEKLQLFDELNSAQKVEINALGLPRFEVETDTISIVDALKNMGIKEAFEEGYAKFGILNDDLYVTDVLHKAKIKVDECGTEAAAATAVIMEKETAAEPIGEIYNFVADKPFVYAIRDVETGVILFLGTYIDAE